MEVDAAPQPPTAAADAWPPQDDVPPSGQQEQQAGQQQHLSEPDLDARKAWVLKLRRAFSPPGMLHADGSVIQDFFRPKRVVLVQDRRWGDAEKELLTKGLEKFGVGSWKEISESFLPEWTDQQLRLRTCRLLGTQSLARYMGWKGNAQAADAEFASNKQVGQATGCWKSGMLVEDDQGSVAKYRQQQQQQQ